MAPRALIGPAGRTVSWSTVAGQENHPVLAGVPNSFTFFAEGHDSSTGLLDLRPTWRRPFRTSWFIVGMRSFFRSSR